MNVRDIPIIAVIFVIAGITLAVGANLSNSVQTAVRCNANTSAEQCASVTMPNCCIEFPRLLVAEGERAQLSASNATSSLGELAKWMPTIGLVIAASIIIGVVFFAMMGRRD